MKSLREMRLKRIFSTTKTKPIDLFYKNEPLYEFGNNHHLQDALYTKRYYKETQDEFRLSTLDSTEEAIREATMDSTEEATRSALGE